MKNRKQEMILTHYFSMLRQLSLLGFFSSELSAMKALRYVAVPGRYDGDLPYKKGDRLWATKAVKRLEKGYNHINQQKLLES